MNSFASLAVFGPSRFGVVGAHAACSIHGGIAAAHSRHLVRDASPAHGPPFGCLWTPVSLGVAKIAAVRAEVRSIHQRTGLS